MRNLILLSTDACRNLARLAARVRLAGRFWLKLRYSWHLAWIKAERS